MKPTVLLSAIKRRVNSFTGRLLFWSGAHRRLYSDAAVIVAFHRVDDEIVEDGLTCGVKKFDEYCRFFSKYFHVVPLSEIIERLRLGKSLGRTLAITFDDGYLDNYTNARLILKRYELPATFFVTTKFIGADIVPPWDRQSPRPWMTWEHLRIMKDEGFEIGAHSRSHADLGALSNEEAWNEIYGSKVDLEEQLGIPITLFAYPFGGQRHITEPTRSLIEQAGFIACCSSHGGITVPGANPFKLYRAPVSEWFVTPYHFGTDLLREVWRAKKHNCLPLSVSGNRAWTLGQ